MNKWDFMTTPDENQKRTQPCHSGKKPAGARPKEQQDLEKKKETIKTGEVTKVALWAAAGRRA